jgi:hypothetical protein
MDWKTGDYADPILPVGKATFKVLSAKAKETSGGTPFVSIMARVDEFLDDFNADDPSVLVPTGQTAFGTIWLPKPSDDMKKALGKQRRVRAFLEAIEADGAELEADDGDSPVDVLTGNLAKLIGKKFKSEIAHTEGTEDYPEKAEVSFFQVRRA